MNEPKRYFQLIHTDEDGSKTYRIIYHQTRCAGVPGAGDG